MKAEKLKKWIALSSVCLAASASCMPVLAETDTPEINENTRVVLNEEGATEQAQDTLALAQAEWESQTGNALALVVAGEEEVKEDDIAVSLDPKRTDLSFDGYEIEWGSPITLEAANERGLLYGFRSIAQTVIDGDIPAGTIETEHAAVEERSLHLDMARKYFDKEWIKDRIVHLSSIGMNTLQLHFSENEGFRIECESHQEVMSDQYLTKEDIREILDFAKLYQVEIIPALDSPEHLKQALATHPEFCLENADGELVDTALNITDEQAVEFVKDLYEEYAELFKGCKYFHIGGDEFINFTQTDTYPQLAAWAEEHEGMAPIDCYVTYLNDIASMLEEKGFTCRVWNDGLYHDGTNQTLDLKKSVQVDYWTCKFPFYQSAQDWIDKGYTIVNFCEMVGWGQTMMYYVVGTNWVYPHVEPKTVYDTFHAGVFPCLPEAGSPAQPVIEPENYPEQLKGASMAIWCDEPDKETPEEVAENIQPILQALAAKLWNPAVSDSIAYEEFAAGQKSYEEIPGLSSDLPELREFEIISSKQPLYRLYNPNSGEHFFTLADRERDYLAAAGWNDEGTAWICPAMSEVPVYRLYNPNVREGDHHYTTSKKEYDYLTSVGWTGEGIAYYAKENGETEIYRLYNPNAKSGSHHFTSSAAERDYLVSAGWKDEGTAHLV